MIFKVVSEFGKEYHLYIDKHEVYPLIVSSLEKGGVFKLIHYINPYGLTLFNNLQLDIVFSDFCHLKEFASTDDQIEAINHILHLIEFCKERYYYYLRIEGD